MTNPLDPLSEQGPVDETPQSETSTNTESETQQMDEIAITPFESSAEWVFQWTGEHGEYEISYVNAREVWLRRARYTDDDGTLGGWNDPQEVDLGIPKTYEDAEQIAQSYIRRK